MRTTVDLPPAVHRRARKLAQQRGSSLSAVLVDLAVRGLAQLDAPVHLSVDSRFQLPVLSVGRRITSEDVARDWPTIEHLPARRQRAHRTDGGQHEHHDRASEWLGQVEAFAVCPIVEGALVRFVVRLGESASTAIELLRGVRQHPRCLRCAITQQW